MNSQIKVTQIVDIMKTVQKVLWVERKDSEDRDGHLNL